MLYNSTYMYYNNLGYYLIGIKKRFNIGIKNEKY